MAVTEADLSQLELEEEAAGKQVSLEEKRALIRKAKKRYGKDYLKFFSQFTGKDSGMDWNALRFKLG